MILKSHRHRFAPGLSLVVPLLLGLGSSAVAQVPTTWTGGNGVWSDSSKWTGGVPNSASADAFIDSQPGTNSVVTITSVNPNNPASFTVGRLRIDAGDTVDTGTTFGSFTVSNTAFAGAGELHIDGTFAMPGGGRTLTGNPMTINGSGALVLGSAGHRPDVLADLTNNARIEGAGRFGAANASRYVTVNNGTIDANLPGMHIDFHNLGNTNTGLLKASNGGQLLIGQGSWNNIDGEVEADGPNSMVAFYRGGFFEGGTLTAKNGGVLQIGGSFNGSNGEHTFKNVTLNGPTNLLWPMLIVGTLTNNGTITIPSGFPTLHNATGAPVTIAGSGEIVLNAPEDGDAELIEQGDSSRSSVPWTFEGITVRGRGNVGDKGSYGAINNVVVTNRGTFQADVDGQPLLIDVSGFDNETGGILRATGSGNNPQGGILKLTIDGPLKNTGGTIEALNGGRVEAGFARIEGGLIRVLPETIASSSSDAVNGVIPAGEVRLGGMTLVNPGTGMRLEGDVKLGVAGVNQEAFIIGAIENAGILRIAAAPNFARLRIGESPSRSASLVGGGQVILGDAANGSMESALMEQLTNHQTYTLTNVDNTIRGFGRIGDPTYDRWLVLNNTGTITADVPGKTLQMEVHSGDNTGGTISATNGGLLKLWGRFGIDNVDGLFKASGADSSFSFHAGTQVTGGLFHNDGGIFDLGNATLVNPGSGMTLQGPFVINNARDARFVGDISSSGSVRVAGTGSDTRLYIGRSGAPNVHMTGGGDLVLDDSDGGTGARGRIEEGTNDAYLYLDDQGLRGNGWVGWSRELNVVNNDAIVADVNGKMLGLYTDNLINSPGKTMEANGGGRLLLDANWLQNTNASIVARQNSIVEFGYAGHVTTVVGGSVQNVSGGTLRLPHSIVARDGVVFANAGVMDLGAAGGNTFNGTANGGSSIVSSGTINKLGGSDYTVNSPLNNTGTIHVQSGILRWAAGGTVAGANLSSATGTHLFFQNAPFTFSGINTFTGAGNHWFANNTVTLADAPTTLNISGNFNLGSIGTTTVSGPGTMNVTGNLTIHSGPSIFSGAQLFTASGTPTVLNSSSSLQFQNNAKWQNSGPVTINTSEPINGTSGTLFTNTATGVLTANSGNQGNLDMPYENSGTFTAGARRLHLRRAGVFKNGKAISSGEGTHFEAPLSLEGTANTATGPGFMNIGGSLTFATGAKLTAERIAFHGTSGATGGELQVSAAANFHPPSFQTSVIDGTQMRLLSGSTNSFGVSRGTLRLQNGAAIRNAGSFNIDRRATVELNSGAVLENAGTLTTTSPGNGPSYFGGDGTGLFRTLADSTTRFHYSGDPNHHFVSVPFDLAGQFYADPGAYTVFNKGGLLNETAKIWPNGPGATITFTGPNPVQSRGRAVEFSGTGAVNFDSTTLEFLPSTLSSTGNGQLDETSINAGARVGFQGNNTIKSSQALADLGRQGRLNTTGFIFANGSQVVDNAVLETSGTANDSVWNANGQKLTLQNGAKFINGGRFVIQSKVGSGVAGDPGITTDNTATLFHNTSTGRIVHDTATTTDFNIDFLNEGFLEFRAGTFNFLKAFSGRGGIAASNGAQLKLSLAGVPESQQPQLFEITGANSKINLQLAAGQTLAAGITLNGGQMVAAGGLNMVAAGGLNLVAAGGGNMVAAGGMNMVAAGGGNIISQNGGVMVAAGGGNMVAAGGGNITATGANSSISGNQMVAAGGGNILSHNGGVMVAAGGLNAEGAVTADAGTIRNEGTAPMVAAGGGNILSHNGGVMVAAGGGNILSQNGGVMVAAGGGNILSQNGGVMVAAGGGNLVAAGGGNLVAAGGGNLVAAGGLNVNGGVAEWLARRAEVAQANTAQLAWGDAEPARDASRAALMQRYSEVNNSTPVGIITVEAGGFAKAQNGSSIVAESGGVLKGAGTFEGPGVIKSGGAMMPGSSPGTVTWTGNLTFESGSLLDIEIGGTTAGTQYDVVNVSGTTVMNGALNVRLLNGFASSIQPTDTFDVLNAGSAINTALAGNRVAVTGINASFAIQLVNDGKTLRLTDYKFVAPTFSSWAAGYGLTGESAAWNADPNGNGLSNLLEYALGLDPTAIGGSTGMSTGIVNVDGQKYLSLSYTKPTGQDAPSDITYTPERATALAPANWSSSAADLVTHSTVAGPGSLQTVTVRSTQPLGQNAREFLHLKVTLTAP